MRCKACHYSLANLTGRRCPECGREFDPNDPNTFSTDERLTRDPDSLGCVGVLLIAGFIYVGAFLWVFTAVHGKDFAWRAFSAAAAALVPTIIFLVLALVVYVALLVVRLLIPKLR